MMNTVQLQFLKNKIADIESALFSNESEAVLKLPSTIITAMSVDDSGQIWFSLTPPSQHLQEFDKEFPAKLRFFKKGKPYFLHVSGKAFIMNDPEQISQVTGFNQDVIEKAANNQTVIVKMAVQKAEYFEGESSRSVAGFSSFVNKIFSWLFDHKPGMKPAYRVHDTAAA